MWAENWRPWQDNTYAYSYLLVVGHWKWSLVIFRDFSALKWPTLAFKAFLIFKWCVCDVIQPIWSPWQRNSSYALINSPDWSALQVVKCSLLLGLNKKEVTFNESFQTMEVRLYYHQDSKEVLCCCFVPTCTPCSNCFHWSVSFLVLHGHLKFSCTDFAYSHSQDSFFLLSISDSLHIKRLVW